MPFTRRYISSAVDLTALAKITPGNPQIIGQSPGVIEVDISVEDETDPEDVDAAMADQGFTLLDANPTGLLSGFFDQPQIISTSTTISNSGGTFEVTNVVTITLPSLTAASRGICLKNVSGGNVTVAPDGSDAIDGVNANQALADMGVLRLSPGSTGWLIL